LDFDLGEPINLSNFKYILDGTFAELRPKDFDRRGRWKWDTGQSYLVGTFELTSEMFSVYSKDYAGSKFVIVYCSDDSQVEYEFEELVSWFKRNDVRRREPVTGYRSKRESPCL
jgi:hypothetical protein